MKPPDSKWLVTPSPRRNRIHSRPILSLLSGPILPFSVIGCLQAYWM